MGMVWAILAHQARPLTDAMGLWREQSAALSAACERRSGYAKFVGKERPAGMLMAPEPSSWLAGARDGCSPASGNRKSIRCLICQLSSPPRRPSRPYICGCAKRTRWIQGTHHEILRELYGCRVRDVRAKGVPSTLAAEQVVSFSSKSLMRGHELAGGREFERRPHRLGVEPSHLADSAPREEPGRRAPRGAW
jgi:hypothetical protein